MDDDGGTDVDTDMWGDREDGEDDEQRDGSRHDDCGEGGDCGGSRDCDSRDSRGGDGGEESDGVGVGEEDETGKRGDRGVKERADSSPVVMPGECSRWFMIRSIIRGAVVSVVSFALPHLTVCNADVGLDRVVVTGG